MDELIQSREEQTTVEDIRLQNANDLNYFASFSLPEVSSDPYPIFYIRVWDFIIGHLIELLGGHNAVFRFALGLPRGHAKTTFCKLLACYAITHKLADFILVVGASENRAENVLADIVGILSSDNYRKVYGDWNLGVIRDTKAEKIAMWQGREVILVAVGAGTAFRGINIRNKRPDMMLIDDAQTKENDESQAERDKLLIWLLGTLLKTRSPQRCFILYVGNMYSESCILEKLRQNPEWYSLITGAILADGNPLWPGLHSIDSLVAEYRHDESMGQGAIWFAEIMNDPIAVATSLFPRGKIDVPSYTEVGEIPSQASFLTIDLAGFKDSSDDNVIAAHHLADDVPIVTDIEAGKFTPVQVITRAIAMALRNRSTVIAVEGIGYQSTLKFWMDLYLKSHNLENVIEVITLTHGKSAKHTRISGWCKEVNSNNYLVMRPEDRAIIFWQGARYKFTTTDNEDDILDACAMGMNVISNHRELILFTFGTNNFEIEPSPGVWSGNSPLDLSPRRAA